MIHITKVRFHLIPLTTRFPFQYGIASMSQAPQVQVQLEMNINGELCHGISADICPPKWFTKDPNTHFEDDLKDMKIVFEIAKNLALKAEPSDSVFTLWLQHHHAVHHWAKNQKVPPLLANFGSSLIERALIDACCRQFGVSLGQALLHPTLGFDPSLIHPECSKESFQTLLKNTAPLKSLKLRHTVGLGDPLDERDVSSVPRPNDDLPLTLEEHILEHHIDHFKIKWCGDFDKDRQRLLHCQELIQQHLGENYAFTLDGNEQFDSIISFKNTWTAFQNDKELESFFKKCLFVEQPIHRQHALEDHVGHELQAWDHAPSLIIDESDAELHSFRRAASLGYRGTSHKNCKGVFKSFANLSLQAYYHSQGHDPYILSAEDLANAGPIALCQDLNVVAHLGIEHVERNGHHYFCGLNDFPKAWQQKVCERQSALFEKSPQGRVQLKIQRGKLQVQDLANAQLGSALSHEDLSELEPML